MLAAFAALVSPHVLVAEGPTVPVVNVAPDEYLPSERGADLLRVDEDMRQFFDQRVSRRDDEDARLRRIVDAIRLPEGLGFRYDPPGTYDAREAFRRRSGNCVTFAFLVVAIAREYGLEARFQDVETSPQWDRRDQYLVSIRHMNVRVDAPDAISVVDLRPDLILPPGRDPGRDGFAWPSFIDAMRPVPDEWAFARLYNNVGFKQLSEGKVELALRLMSRATAIDPGYAEAWANRATVQVRIGDVAGAMAGFERALQIAPREVAALDGLAVLLRRRGAPDDVRRAEKLERQSRAAQERNPYFHYQLAREAEARGDWAEADRRLKRAVRLKDDEDEFYAAQVGVYRHLGRLEDARRAADKCEALRRRIAVETVAAPTD